MSINREASSGPISKELGFKRPGEYSYVKGEGRGWRKLVIFFRRVKFLKFDVIKRR